MLLDVVTTNHLHVYTHCNYSHIEVSLADMHAIAKQPNLPRILTAAVRVLALSYKHCDTCWQMLDWLKKSCSGIMYSIHMSIVVYIIYAV